ncbi:MAG: hypothetical protein IPP35_07925 [Elusimicrobia bacterium]|nr:hypothetical protein [Elusimicrobiota bacterium]
MTKNILLPLDPFHPLNLKALAFLKEGVSPEIPMVANPGSSNDPYLKQGSHPDVVQRLWDVINASLPQDSRCLVFGSPALIHPKKGIILGFCSGSNYFLRLPSAAIIQAEEKGAKKVIEFTIDEPLDIHRDLGADWVCGSWWEGEVAGCQTIFNQV